MHSTKKTHTYTHFTYFLLGGFYGGMFRLFRVLKLFSEKPYIMDVLQLFVEGRESESAASVLGIHLLTNSILTQSQAIRVFGCTPV